MHKRYKRENIIYSLLTWASRIVDRIFAKRRYLLAMFILGIVFLFIAIRFKRIFFTSALIGLGSVSMLYQRYFRYAHYVGFELCMMATVLVALAYGPAFGAFAGGVTIFAALILSGSFKHSSFISVLTLPLIGAITPFFSNLPLLYIGLLMTLFYDAIILPLYILLGSRVASSAIFFVTHVLLNLWVFSTIAPFIYRLMI